MLKEKDKFINFLKDKDLKLTKQREEILETFLKTEKHLAAEDLYNAIKKKNPAIGQATVFRTLKLICEADLAKEVYFGDKTTRYEHKYGHEHHDHLVCIKCGRSIEAVDPRIEKLQEALCKKIGFLPKRHKLDIFGVCKKCRTKTKKGYYND